MADQITEAMIDAHEAEWDRWSLRTNNDQGVTLFEIVRGPGEDEPISDETLKVIEAHATPYHLARYRMERLRIEASIKAALEAQ